MKQIRYIVLFLFISVAVITYKQIIRSIASIPQFSAPQPYSIEKKQLLTKGRISGNPQIILHDAHGKLYFLKPLMRATGFSALVSELIYGHVAHTIGTPCQQSWVFTPDILSSQQKKLFPELTHDYSIIISYLKTAHSLNDKLEKDINYSGYSDSGIRDWLLQITSYQPINFDLESLLAIAALNCFFQMGDRSPDNLLWDTVKHQFVSIDNANAFDQKTKYAWTTSFLQNKKPLSPVEKQTFFLYQKALETIIYAYPIPNDLFKIVEAYGEQFKKQCPTLPTNDLSAAIQSFNASIQASYARIDDIIKQIQAELSR